ncbi:MAG: type II toxin-antitoxin system RelE/ParE family toxin [Terriglobia bacterium]
MQIVWTETAVRHLSAIQAYIEQEEPEAAQRVAAAIRKAVAYLAVHPHLGRAGRKPGTRELVIADTPYLVPYTVKGDRVTILAVLHGAQRRREI